MSEFKMVVEPVPEHGNRKRNIDEAINFARAANGEWCAVDESASRNTLAMRTYYWKRHPKAAGFEFTCRKSGDKFRMYCRYVGNNQAT